MKTLVSIGIVLFSGASLAQETPEPAGFPYNENVVLPVPPSEDQIYKIVDKSPEFPGGKAALNAYIHENLRVPTDKPITGKCLVQFVVGKDGYIRDVMIIRGIEGSPECNPAVIRLVKSMPNWTPGILNNQPVASYYTLPITFEPR